MKYSITRAVSLTGVAFVAALLLSLALTAAYTKGATDGANYMRYRTPPSVDICESHT